MNFLKKTSNLRVIAYDRAGLGWSEPAGQPYGIDREVEALRIALEKMGVSKNIIMVGHSYGGFMARLYAEKFPASLVGLVLVDGNTNYFFNENPEVIAETKKSSQLLKYLNRSGLIRLFVQGEYRNDLQLLEEQDAAVILDLTFSVKHLQAQAEMLAAFPATVARMEKVSLPKRLKTVVLIRGKRDSHALWSDDKRERDWWKGQ